MEVNLVVEGLKFMMIGMSIVFIFLILLVFFINLMSKIIHRYFPEPNQVPPSGLDSSEQLKKVAAIAAAIHHDKRG